MTTETLNRMTLKFAAYMVGVDRVLIDLVGCPSDCLPDCDYYMMFDNGFTHRQAALHAIEYAETC